MDDKGFKNKKSGEQFSDESLIDDRQQTFSRTTVAIVFTCRFSRGLDTSLMKNPINAKHEDLILFWKNWKYIALETINQTS